MRSILEVGSEQLQQFIAMTANAFKEDKEAAFAAGMNDYIIKPVDIASLLQKLVAVLSSAI